MSTSRGTYANDTLDNKPLRTAAAAVGAVFLLVGILGFIPGITSDYDLMEFAGHESEAKLLGLFQVSILHNIVHLLFGVAGIAMARSAAGAKNYLIGGGIVYLVLFLLGLFMAGRETAINFIPVNHADNFLHLFLGIGMIALGVLLGLVLGGVLRWAFRPHDSRAPAGPKVAGSQGPRGVPPR